MSANKDKGNALEYYIRDLYARRLDPGARRMPLSGAADGFKGDILKSFYDGWTDECKNQEPPKTTKLNDQQVAQKTKSLPIWEWWEQTKNQCSSQEKPVLHVTSNYKDHLTIIRTEDYFQLREELEDYKNGNVDSRSEGERINSKKMETWKLQNAIKLIKEFLKMYE